MGFLGGGVRQTRCLGMTGGNTGFFAHRPGQPIGFFAVLVERVSELRVSDLDQRLRPLANRLAVQVRNSVFTN